jgi:hypothetical protein
MKSLTIEKQQRLYDALKRIAKDYRSADRILQKPDFGLDGEECLAMAYENIQATAAAAIKGVKRPSSNPKE